MHKINSSKLKYFPFKKGFYEIFAFTNLLILIKYASRAIFESLDEDNKKIMYDIFCEIWAKLIIILEKKVPAPSDCK